MLTCRGCEAGKPESEFYFRADKSGWRYDSLCKICRCAKVQARKRERIADPVEAERMRAHRREDKRKRRRAADKAGKRRAMALQRKAARVHAIEQRKAERLVWKESEPVRRRLRDSLKKQRRKGNLQWRIRDTLAADRKTSAVLGWLGYTPQQLREHIERQFVGRMSWAAFNKGRIHIDHIVPVRCFDLSVEDNVRACYALTNLRPLWSGHNQAKAGKREHLL